MSFASSSQHHQRDEWKHSESYPRLDHVCIPTPHRETLAPFVYNTLLGVNAEGGINEAFYGMAWYIGTSQAKLETIIPTANADVKNNFLQRFLHQHGTTAHHVTFLVDDIYDARKNAESLGYRVVGFDVETDADWLEMFLLPKQSGGIVVQFAQKGPIYEYDEDKQHQLLWGPKYNGFPNHLNKQHDKTKKSNVHMLGVRLCSHDKEQSIKLWQHLLNGKLQRTERERIDNRDIEVLYFYWVHSPMYIAVQIENQTSGDSSQAKDGFLYIEVATSDNSQLDVSEKNTGVQARFKQVPMPRQQNSNL